MTDPHLARAARRDGPSRDIDFGAEANYALTLPVLGIATTFVSNSEHVLGVANEAFGDWRTVEARGDLHLSVRIVVAEGERDDAEHASMTHLCPDAERLIVHSSGCVGVSDPARRESVAFVTTARVRDHAQFRTGVLEALTFALVAQFDRHPLHAAAIARDGRALLLVGESGAGKSTLAYVASRAGFDVLAEDHAWIQLEPELRVWGGARRVRLGLDAASLFPEVATAERSTTVGGKEKRAVELPATARGSMATSATVCLLHRGNGKPALDRLETRDVVDALTTHVSPGFDRFPERHRRVVDHLAVPGGWRLTLSADPRESLPILERLLDDGP